MSKIFVNNGGRTHSTSTAIIVTRRSHRVDFGPGSPISDIRRSISTVLQHYLDVTVSIARSQPTKIGLMDPRPLGSFMGIPQINCKVDDDELVFAALEKNIPENLKHLSFHDPVGYSIVTIKPALAIGLGTQLRVLTSCNKFTQCCGTEQLTDGELDMVAGLADEVVLSDKLWRGNSVSTNF